MAFIQKFWGVIVAAAAFIFGYGRLNAKVEQQAERVGKIENDLSTTLKEIRGDLKEIDRKVDVTKDAQQKMHLDLLDRINAK